MKVEESSIEVYGNMQVIKRFFPPISDFSTKINESVRDQNDSFLN